MFDTFILVGKGWYARSSTENQITLSGEHHYPLETPLPVIIPNKGCFSLGMVTGYHVSKTSTTIWFVESKVSKEDGKAYYALFKNVMSVSDDDSYEQTDTLIPGMAGSVTTANKDRKEERYRDSCNESLSDFLEDEW